MTISVSGLGSGLDYNSWIEKLVALKQDKIDEVSAKVTSVNSQVSALARIQSDYTDLQKAIETFTKALSSTDVFNQKSATSSSDAVTAKVTAGANVGSLKVTVEQLATSTKAESTYTTASYVDGSTTLNNISSGTIKAGTFSVYVDGVKNTLNITEGQSVDSVLTALNGITGVSASVTDGKLTIGASGSQTVRVGAGSDTSNFYDIMSLTATTTEGVTTYSSSKNLFDTDIDAALTSTQFRNQDGSAASVWAGTFKINDVEFEVTADKSLQDIIDEINDSEAGVTASWNANTGKLSLTSTDQGAASIDVSVGTSNFTDVMGFTTSNWTTVGETHTLNSTALNSAAQTMGTNAIITVNGTTVTSSSNTVTSDISGVAGLTLTLNKETKVDETASINITQDTAKVTSAINTFVTALNKVITDTDSATSSDGFLKGESVLTSMRNKLRTMATAAVSGLTGDYTTLSSIGITTGAVGTGVKDKTNNLVVDSDKLSKALAADPEAVKKLFLGDSETGVTGMMDKLESVVDNATDETKGYFVTKDATYDKQIERFNKKIDRMETSLEKYQKQLETKFSAMDEIISSLQNKASIFDSYFNNDNNNKNN